MKPKTREQNFLAKIAGDTNADLTMVPRTAEEYFLNQIAENGGGSGLPSYTSADRGKVLTIGEGEGSETVVIVPEQTVTLENGDALLQNVAISYDDLTVGMTATLYFSDGSISLSIDMSVVEGTSGQDVFLYFTDETGHYSITYIPRNSVWAFYAEDLESTPLSGEYTLSVSASLPSVEPKWEAAGGGIEFFPVTTTASAHTAAITAGEMQQILLAGKVPVGIAVYSGDPVNTYIIGGVAAGEAGYNVIVIGSLTTVTVNELTDYPVLWRSDK